MKAVGILGLLLIASPIFADDGYIEFGGSPKLLSSHRSITMVSENVRIDAFSNRVFVTADFVFKNRGRACKVRMGFPDEDSHSIDGEREKAVGTRLKLSTARLKNFQSWVDGVRVNTSLVQAEFGDQAWHAKTVSFGKNQIRRVRVSYWTPPGMSVIGYKPGTKTTQFLEHAHYVMTTGASWNGPIGYARVTLQVRTAALKLPFQVNSFEDFSKVSSKPHRVALVDGFSNPKVYGRIFVFERRNFEPEEDIGVAWMSSYVSRG